LGLAKDINGSLHRELGCHVAWPPIANTFALGDYGVFANGVFTKLGVAGDFGIEVVAVDSPAGSLKLSSANTRVASFVGDTEVDVIPDGALAAKIQLSFEAGSSFLLRAATLEVREMQNVATAMSRLAKHKQWRRSYKVVSKLWMVEKAAVLSTRSAGTKITLAGDAPALKKFALGEVSANLSIASNQELGFQLLGKAGVVGLGLTHLTLFGGVDTLALDETSSEPVTSSVEGRPDDV
jgi:hypothetical protein